MKLKILAAVLMLGGFAFGQGAQYRDNVVNQNGLPISATVRVCTSSAVGADSLCTSLASIYSDAAMTLPITQPFFTDSLGNFSFFAPAGSYYLQAYGTGLTTPSPVLITLDVPNPSSVGTFKSLNGTLNAAQFTGADIGAQINAAIAALPATGGTIIVPAGTYSFSTEIVLDGKHNITIQGAAGAQAPGLNPPTSMTFTGAAGPIISAGSSYNVRLIGLGVLWNNAAFTGDVVNSDHSAAGGNLDTSLMEIAQCIFASTGSGATATNLLNLNRTISSSIHDNYLYGKANVAILGANLNGQYANVLNIYGNHFSNTTGTIAQAMIRNVLSGEVHANTFELGSALGKPVVFDVNVQVNPTVHFSGNFIGDADAGYTGVNYFNIVGNGAGTGVVGMVIAGNVIGCHNTTDGNTVFHITGASSGVHILGNSISLCQYLVNASGLFGGLLVEANFLSQIGTAFTFATTNHQVVIQGNGYNAIGTFMSGTPSDGVIVDNNNLRTQYGSMVLAGTSTLTLGQTAVGALPSAASNAGAMILVTDSTAVAAEGQTCVGSSTNKALAVSNGSAWKCF